MIIKIELILYMEIGNDNYDISNKILKYFDVQDMVSLAMVSKHHNEFVIKNKHYIKFKYFFDNTLKNHIDILKKNEFIYDDTIKCHKYILALETKCKKIINFFEIPINYKSLKYSEYPGYLYTIVALVTLDDVKNFEIFATYLIEHKMLSYYCFFDFAIKYNATKIINKYFASINESYILEDYHCSLYHHILYISKNKIYINDKLNDLVVIFDNYFDRIKNKTLHFVSCELFNAMANIINDTKLNYDLIEKINELLDFYLNTPKIHKQKIIIRKINYYLKYHISYSKNR